MTELGQNKSNNTIAMQLCSEHVTLRAFIMRF